MLTREQVLALTGREFDAAVAEFVFGYGGIGYYGPPVDPTTPWTHPDSVRYDTQAEAQAAFTRYYEARYPNRPQGIAKPDEFAVYLCWWKDGYGTRNVDEYGTDASDDYAVLCHVREKWGDHEKWRFFSELGAVLANRLHYRDDLKPRDDYTLPVLEAYRPGDYSRAALLTLSKKERP